MTYFTKQELTESKTARDKKIDNTPPPEAVKNMEALIDNVLDPLRRAWGGPITTNSGYRCPRLNAAVGGAAKSQHLTGEAADITVGSVAGNKRLFELAIRLDLPYDQLIDEHGYRWVHISYKRTGYVRHQILHL